MGSLARRYLSRASHRETVVHNSYAPDDIIMNVRMFGGQLRIYKERIQIERFGVINHLLEPFGATTGYSESTLLINKISLINIASPLILNDFLYFSYPGSPPRTGNVLRDATAENAIMMNFFDNRDVYDAIDLILTLGEGRIGSTIPLRRRKTSS